MTTANVADIQALLGSIKGNGETSVNAVKTVTTTQSADAETALKQDTKQAISEVEAEYDEIILAIIDERDSEIAALKAKQEAKAEAIRFERDRSINFFATAKRLVAT